MSLSRQNGGMRQSEALLHQIPKDVDHFAHFVPAPEGEVEGMENLKFGPRPNTQDFRIEFVDNGDDGDGSELAKLVGPRGLLDKCDHM